VALPIILADHALPCDIYEFNDDYLHAWGPLVSGKDYAALLCEGDSVDWYYIDVTRAATVTVTLAVPATVDYDLYLHDAQGVIAESAQYGLGQDERIEKSVAAGRYFVRVYPYSGHDSSNVYRLRAVYP
jgi:hypothetical protein